jgi:hypothetical protein
MFITPSKTVVPKHHGVGVAVRCGGTPLLHRPTGDRRHHVTATGVGEGMVVPLPNSPLPLPPQHQTEWSDSSAHEWDWPAATAVAPLRPETATGVSQQLHAVPASCPVVVPIPSCPWALPPQHNTVPLDSTAQE